METGFGMDGSEGAGDLSFLFIEFIDEAVIVIIYIILIGDGGFLAVSGEDANTDIG